MLNIHNKVHNVCCCCFVAKSHQTLVNPWAVAHQAPLSMQFPKQEYWSGLPFPSPGDLPNTGIEPRYWTHVSCLAGRFVTTGPLGKPKVRNESETRSVMSNSLQPDGLYSPWNSPGQITGVGSLSLLQGTCSTQGSNWGLPHCRWILYQLSHKESPRILEWVAYPFSSRSSRPRNWTRVSCISGEFFTNWPLKEALKTRERLLKATLERENSFWTSLFKMKLKVRCSIWTVGHQ